VYPPIGKNSLGDILGMSPQEPRTRILTSIACSWKVGKVVGKGHTP
jgi:hypothetical protein